MLTFHEKLAGEQCAVRVVQSSDDLRAFIAWLPDQRVMGVDTETTGLDIYTTGHRVHTIQFANRNVAWVLHPTPRHLGAIRRALLSVPFLVMHNATYDMLVTDHHLGVQLEEMAGKTFDTSILAHLLDPRNAGEGGLGRKLKDLARVWVDPEAPDSERVLIDRFHELKTTKDKGWAVIDSWDPVLLRYAGVDPILTVRLFDELRPLCQQAGLQHLVEFEHHLQGLLARMQRRGMLIDVDYTAELRTRLAAEAKEHAARAVRWGVSSLNAPAQVAAALLAMGEQLEETTASGAPKVDKEVLMPLADLDRDWQRIGAREPNELADAVLRGKRAGKWATSYAQAFLDLRDGADRIHPSINGLQARTARMSVSRPPLQQLPSSDWTVRRAFLADPGQVMLSVDYSQIEMRVLAGVSGDKAMTQAIMDGVDLHDFTAKMLFGEGFTKPQRKLAKGVGFGKVYGGGKVTLSRQTGAPIAAVASAIKAYDQTFIGIARYSRGLQRSAEYGKKEVVTPTGRHLPLDRQRLYAATNYVVQSTARDVLAQAIVNMYEAGLGDYFLLPIHDEVLGQAPVAEAEDVVREMKRVMEQHDFMGIPLVADGEILGPTWGHGYGAPS